MRIAPMATLLAIAVSTPGLIAVQAHAPGLLGHGPNRMAPINVADDDLGVAGVDVGNAGTSKQSRLNYVNGLLQDTQATIWARCGEILAGKDASNDTVAFCKDVLPTR
jgi:hypothetical protein